MNRDQLIESACDLRQVAAEAADEYEKKRESNVAEINRRMLSRADIEELVGARNIDMMKDNHANHGRFVGSILRRHNPDVLVETVLWVYRAYRTRGFHTNYWAAQLNTWITILKESLSEESYGAIYPLYNWFQVNIPLCASISEEQILSDPLKDCDKLHAC